MKALGVLAAIYVAATLATAALAKIFGSPFALWFADTHLLLGTLLGAMLVLGVLWDGLLVSLGVLSEAWQRRHSAAHGRWPTVESLRRARFFTCGALPIPILLVTGLAVLGTSNITLLSLAQIGKTTQWRDAFFWSIEAPLLTQLQSMAIDVASWDRLYHSAWAIEILAAFALVVVARGARIVLHYGLTMIVLFYLGRLLGMLNPVMGPAFYRPEFFAYLDGSATSTAMRLVAEMMSLPIDRLVERGGILLGGVSAMPSLHVAMVATTAYWLATASRWTIAVTVPWVIAVWTSTVVLGWHYALDGAGGFVLAGISIALTRVLLNRLGLGQLNYGAMSMPRAGTPAAG